MVSFAEFLMPVSFVDIFLVFVLFVLRFLYLFVLMAHLNDGSTTLFWLEIFSVELLLRFRPT